MVWLLVLTLLSLIFATELNYEERMQKEAEFKRKLKKFEAHYEKLKGKALPANELVKVLEKKSFQLPDGRVFKFVAFDLSSLGDYKEVYEFQPVDKAWVCNAGNRLNLYAEESVEEVTVYLGKRSIDFLRLQIDFPSKVYKLHADIKTMPPSQPFQLEVQGGKLKLPVEVFSVWGYSIYNREKLTDEPCHGREIPLKSYLLGVEVNIFRDIKIDLPLKNLPD